MSREESEDIRIEGWLAQRRHDLSVLGEEDDVTVGDETARDVSNVLAELISKGGGAIADYKRTGEAAEAAKKALAQKKPDAKQEPKYEPSWWDRAPLWAKVTGGVTLGGLLLGGAFMLFRGRRA